MRVRSYSRIRYITISLVCLTFLTMCAGVGYSAKIKRAMTPEEIAILAKDIATDSSLSYDQKNKHFKDLSIHTIEIIKRKISTAVQSSPKEAKDLLGEVYDILSTNKDMLIKYTKDEYNEISREYRDLITNKIKDIL